jgi:putative sterol carrier protein
MEEEAMSESVQEFFAALATRRYEPLLHSVSGTVQWTIEGVGHWNVVLNKGAITVSREAVVPDSVMSCSEDTFLALAKGVQNPLTAFLQGKLALQGNIALAQVFQRIFENQSDKSMNMTSTRREP